MNSTILEKINFWKNNKNLVKELKDELDNLTDEQLYEAFYTDLEFGTGGMRGIIGAGVNRMNIYTIRSANYGYAMYLNEESKNPSCVIAYDNRHKSKEFAKESARVLSKYNVLVYLFNKITPTPELSYAVRYLKATGGIVITASHNPPMYNGYKIYDESGCQLVPPLASRVIDYIKNSPDPFDLELEDFDSLVEKGKVVYLDENIDLSYLEEVKSILCKKDLDKKNFNVTFTALHGTSAYLGCKILEECGYNVTKVTEQLQEDPNFTTVKSPNPEDPNAFKLAITYATKNNSDIIIATDPDADRVGLAVLHNNEYVLLNGNQTGAILIDYLAKFKKLSKKGVMFNTIVTSNFGKAIASKYGIKTISTLTGFKFIGEQIKLLSNDEEFFFGYEESYGYVVKEFVRDKDSIQALILCSEVSCYYKSLGKTLIDVLNDLYDEFGFYDDSLININLAGSAGALRIERILNHFRSIEKIEGIDLIRKEDYLKQVSLDLKTNKITSLTLPKSNVLKFFIDENSYFVLRPSGTEPKMKLYISTIGKNKKEVIQDIVMKLIDEVE